MRFLSVPPLYCWRRTLALSPARRHGAPPRPRRAAAAAHRASFLRKPRLQWRLALAQRPLPGGAHPARRASATGWRGRPADQQDSRSWPRTATPTSAASNGSTTSACCSTSTDRKVGPGDAYAMRPACSPSTATAASWCQLADRRASPSTARQGNGGDAACCPGTPSCWDDAAPRIRNTSMSSTAGASRPTGQVARRRPAAPEHDHRPGHGSARPGTCTTGCSTTRASRASVTTARRRHQTIYYLDPANESNGAS
jgi:hypothetical protein